MNELLELTDGSRTAELAPITDQYEREARFPHDQFGVLGRAGLLGLPYPRTGAARRSGTRPPAGPGAAGATLAHRRAGRQRAPLSCHALATAGTDAQRDRWLPDMLGGDLLGAYCLSRPQSGSDAAGLQTAAVRDADGYVLNGTKAWITRRDRRLLHGHDPYRTGSDGPASRHSWCPVMLPGSRRPP